MKAVVMTSEEIEQKYGMSKAELDVLSDDAEKGIFHGEPRGEVIRGQGRPRLSDEDLVTITFKVPRSKRAAADARAAELGETRSDFMREALDAALG